MSEPEPAWYLDPRGAADTFRWWHGSGWTRLLTTDPNALPPGPARALPEDDPPFPEPVEGPESVVGSEPFDKLRERGGPAHSVFDLPEGPQARPGYPMSRRAQGIQQERRSSRLLVGVGVGILALVLVVVGAVVVSRNAIAGGTDIAPPSKPKPSPRPPELTFDDDTLIAEVAPFSVMIPGDPYVCFSDPTPRAGMYSSGITCNGRAFEDYDGDADWFGAIGIGVLDPSLVVTDDITASGQNFWDALKEEFFTDMEITAPEPTISPLDTGSPDIEGVVFQGDVQYDVKDLPATADKMTVMLIELPDGVYGDGGYVAWSVSRPNKGPAALKAEAQKSFRSIKIG